jgi:hypothetical protein
MKRNNEVLSKEGEVVGQVGNMEVDPFRQQLAESADEAVDEAQTSLPLELKGMAHDEHHSASSQSSATPIADIHGNKRKNRPGDQPLPKVNGATDCQTTFRERIACDVAVRREIGIQRYGTALQPFNGRSAVQDAWEEFIDLGQYIEQIRRERHDMIELIRETARITHAGDGELRYLAERAQTMLDGLGITR